LALLQKEQEGHQPVGTHTNSFTPKQAKRWPHCDLKMVAPLRLDKGATVGDESSLDAASPVS